jgi:hypothetical protein
VTRFRIGRAARAIGLLLAAALGAGCAATVKEIRRHPQQERLERLLSEVLPHTKYPDKHYWVRVADPSKDRIGLTVLPQRHIYLAESLVGEADDATLRALIVHAVAHHRLHHYNQRSIVGAAQRAAFKVGGSFVPGLSHGHHIGAPASEFLISPRQEASADAKTAVYLQRMGGSEADFARALDLLAERDLRERIGRTTSGGQTLRNRAARARKRAGKEPLPSIEPTPAPTGPVQ